MLKRRNVWLPENAQHADLWRIFSSVTPVVMSAVAVQVAMEKGIMDAAQATVVEA